MRPQQVRLCAFWKCQSASSAVEFALVIPLFLLLLFGMLVYGGHLAVVHGLQQLAAEAARQSIGGLSETERTTLAKAYVAENANAYPLIVPASLKVNASTSASDANVFVVTVNYDASSLFIYALPQIVPTPSSQITRSAAIARGGY